MIQQLDADTAVSGSPAFEITEEMVRAGMAATEEFPLYGESDTINLTELVQAVYIAMRKTQLLRGTSRQA